MRVLITGASGFTGLHLTQYLRQLGHDVIPIGQERDSELHNYRQVDLLDNDRLLKTITETLPTHVVHLAAKSHVVGEPLDFYHINLRGTENLLAALGKSDIDLKKVVIASSANVYGNADSKYIAETQAYQPMNHYGMSKVTVELAALHWFTELPIVIARPFNYTGPGQSENFVFQKIVKAFKRRDTALKLGRTDVFRDLSDVRFVVSAYKALLDQGVNGEIYNICSGQAVSIEQTIQIVAEISGHMIDIQTDERLVRDNEITYLCGDPSKLRALAPNLDHFDLVEIFRNMYNAASD